MIILSEKKLRKVIREEFERFMEVPQIKPEVVSIKSPTGGELIFPSPIKEAFDEGKVTSVADILNA